MLILLGALKLLSKDSGFTFPPKNTDVSPNQLIINNLDSIIFDLSNSTLTANFIDIPIYLISDDVINSFDYAIKFNLTKLTFSTTIDVVPSDPTIISSAYFNSNDLFLRYTGSSLQGYPKGVNVYVTKIRFALSSPCVPISAADFTNILAILNGTQCSFRVTNLNFGKFFPGANANAGPTCLKTSIQFSDASTISSGTISSWSWNFDNGNTSVLQNPLISYTTAGAATATLIVTASTGCKDTIVMPFTINLLPVSSFSYSVDCIKDSVFFTNSSTIPSGTITSALWNFGDTSGSSILTNPSYHYNASGFYTVTLVVTSDFSCTAASTVMVNLTNKVSANFTTTSVNNCLRSLISFSNVSTYLINVINAWAWDFGNGSTSTQQNPSYTYTVAGTYPVMLTSTSADGCKGFITQNIIINAPPAVQFGISTLTTCALATASFTDLSTSTASSNWLWNFGNGLTSKLQNPVYSYSTSGVYNVKLVVVTVGGCADSLIVPYTVSLPSPGSAPFSHSVVSNSQVSFSNLNSGSVNITWDFGDGQNSFINNPLHVFPDVATYKVCLTTFNTSGCVSSSCKDIFVGFSRIVAIPSSFTPNKDGNNDVLKVKGGPLTEMEFQIFNEWGNLLFSSTSQDIGWDGTFKGDQQPVGVYEYILNAKTQDNKTISLYGVVNLTR